MEKGHRRQSLAAVMCAAPGRATASKGRGSSRGTDEILQRWIDEASGKALTAGR